MTAKEVKQLLDGIPKDMPVLIDEAYHHFVDDPAYGTSVPYVLEGRPVIIARTFSKIAALAGDAHRLRRGAAGDHPADARLRVDSVNVLAKWGGVASLKDTAGQADVKAKIIDAPQQDHARARGARLPGDPVADQLLHGQPRRPQVQPVIEEFRTKGILVGRPFPPMLNHLRVSVGTPEEMEKFMAAFKEIFPAKAAATAARG